MAFPGTGGGGHRLIREHRRYGRRAARKGQENFGIDAGLAGAVDGGAKLFDSAASRLPRNPTTAASRLYCPRQTCHDVVVVPTIRLASVKAGKAGAPVWIPAARHRGAQCK